MPLSRKPRKGSPIEVKGRSLDFSYWPMYRGNRRYGLQTRIYATNPWALIRTAIKSTSPSSVSIHLAGTPR